MKQNVRFNSRKPRYEKYEKIIMKNRKFTN